MNSKDDLYETEPIPDWKEFKKERKEKNQYQGYKMTDERRLEISSMLAKSIPQLQISKALRCSCTTIRNAKGVTLLAAIGMAISKGVK